MLAGAFGLAGLTIAFPLPDWVITESNESSGPVETLQMVCWLAAAAIGLAIALAPRVGRRDRWLRGWLCVFSLQAAFREADLHEWLNADHWTGSGYEHLAVSFRIDWWLDGATPIWIKLVWGVVFGIAIGALILPLVVARVPFVRLGLRGHFAVQCMGMAALCLVMGYAADDLVGRNQFVRKAASKSAEEMLELAGVLFWLTAVCVWAVRRIPVLKAPKD